MTRLPGSGTLPRIFAGVLFAIVTVFVGAWLASDTSQLIPALVLEALAVVVVVRSFFVGVLLAPNAVVVRGWVRTFRYGRGELRSVGVVPYWKFLRSDPPSAALLKFTPEQGWVREIASTVAWRDRPAEHAARIREHLGIAATGSARVAG